MHRVSCSYLVRRRIFWPVFPPKRPQLIPNRSQDDPGLGKFCQCAQSSGLLQRTRSRRSGNVDRLEVSSEISWTVGTLLAWLIGIVRDDLVVPSMFLLGISLTAVVELTPSDDAQNNSS